MQVLQLTLESVQVLLRKVGEDECPFLWGQLVLLHTELLQQLPPGDREDGLEETAAKHLSCLIPRQAVVTLRDVAVTQPPDNVYEK